MKGYVGKTNNPRTRLPKHLQECRDQKHYRANWLKALTDRKLIPTLEVVDEVPFEHWPQLEVAYIEFFLEQGYELTNGTPGGEDPPPGWGRKKSPETVAKFRAAVSGENHWTFGKEFSPQYCAKFSRPGEKNSNFGKRASEETRAKQSKVRKGRKLTPEQCAARSLAFSGAGNPNFGKTMSAEQKVKISAAKKGCTPWNKGKKKA